MTITIKTAHDKFLCALPDGSVIADRVVASDWEQWTPARTGIGPDEGTMLVSLKSAHGKYLSAQADGTLVADRATAGPWEWFTVPLGFPVGP